MKNKYIKLFVFTAIMVTLAFSFATILIILFEYTSFIVSGYFVLIVVIVYLSIEIKIMRDYVDEGGL